MTECLGEVTFLPQDALFLEAYTRVMVGIIELSKIDISEFIN